MFRLGGGILRTNWRRIRSSEVLPKTPRAAASYKHEAQASVFRQCGLGPIRLRFVLDVNNPG